MHDPAPEQPLQDCLTVHNRLRVMGAIERGEVDVGPLLGRGAFGRVYKGAPACHCGVLTAAPTGTYRVLRAHHPGHSGRGNKKPSKAPKLVLL